MNYLTQKQIPEYRAAHKPDSCPILGNDQFEEVLDHDHKTGRVRGVISNQANVLVGKIENFFKSRCAHSVNDLPTCLREIANYLEQQQGPLHPVGLRQLTRRFKNKKKTDQIAILEEMGIDHQDCKNRTQRAELYRKAIKENA